jgi:hypothetical protein
MLAVDRITSLSRSDLLHEELLFTLYLSLIIQFTISCILGDMRAFSDLSRFCIVLIFFNRLIVFHLCFHILVRLSLLLIKEFLGASESFLDFHVG